MNHRTAMIFSAGAATLAALGNLTAQNQSRGLLAGAATAVLVDGGLGGANDAETQFHRNGFLQAPPQTFPALPSSPDLAGILQAHGAPPGIDVDDISTGRDEVLVDTSGVLQVPTFRWSVWSFSLKNGAVGLPGSAIAAEAASGSVGSALFSWVLPGSNLPPQVVGVTERSHSRRDLGLGGVNPEVDGIDFPLALGLDQGLALAGGAVAVEPGFAPLIGFPQAIYFTVSSATAPLVPAAWWGGTPPSGATIFVTLKSSPAGGWSPPFVFRPYFDLGLAQSEDIDALAYDAANEKLLFSTTGTSRDQFLFEYLGTDGAAVPTPVTTTSGTPVSTTVGKAQNDDVDAVCTLDPQLTTFGGLPPGGDDFGSSVGAPRQGLLGVPTISGSAYRRYQGGLVRFDTFLVGWPPNAGPAPGLAAAFLTTGNNFDPLLIGGVHVRNPGNPNPGDPQTETVVVPAAISLTGADVTFRWIAIDGTTGELAEAWPARAFL